MSFKPKVGIVSCSGEDCPGGNISRAATLKVLHELRPDETVTICLPLFLAGGEGERGFAERFPTVTVDGCGKLCAALGTERYSSEPSVKLNVEDFYGDSIPAESEKSKIGSSIGLVDLIANNIVEHVDRLREDWG